MALHCDLIGPSQHTGECSFDTIQYLLFNADGLKEQTRPLFTSLRREELEELVKTTERNAIHFRDAIDISIGVWAIKERFDAHYDFLENAGVCAGDPVARKRSISMNTSRVAANRLQDPIHRPNGFYNPGNTPEHALRLLNYMFQLFGLPFLAQDRIPAATDLGIGIGTGDERWVELGPEPEPEPERAPTIDTVGIYLTTDELEYSPERSYHARGSHALGIVKCNATWFLYDDNTGVYPINYEMVKFIIEHMQNQYGSILAIKLLPANKFILYILGRRMMVEGTWLSNQPALKSVTEVPYPLNETNVYAFVSYFTITPTVTAGAGGRRKTRHSNKRRRKSRKRRHL